MSHLLKRTKKSCLKIFRKISSSRQLFAKKTDENDDATNNNNQSSRNNNNNTNTNASNNKNSQDDYEEYSMDIETTPIPQERVNHSFRKSTDSLPSMTTYQQHHQHHEQQQQQQHQNIETTPTMIEKSMSFELDEGSPSNTILHKLTARLFLTADGYDFHRLQHLRSDTGSEVEQFDVDTTDFIDDDDDNIVFEKVKYKNDIRYFRHTPSNSSLDNYRLNSVVTTPDSEISPERTFESISNANNDHRGGGGGGGHSQKLRNQFTNFGFQAPKEMFVPTVNMTLGSKLNGNQQNVIISQERDTNNKLMPVVKWDINGNSLDDDGNDEVLPHEYLQDYDRRLSKRLAAIQHFKAIENDDDAAPDDDDDDDESGDSSLRSSSTTLETWVDEDLIVESSTSKDNFELSLIDNRCLKKT